jgi:hypothetical protein
MTTAGRFFISSKRASRIRVSSSRSQTGGGPVKKYDGGVFEEGTANRKAPPLPGRETGYILKEKLEETTTVFCFLIMDLFDNLFY